LLRFKAAEKARALALDLGRPRSVVGKQVV